MLPKNAFPCDALIIPPHIQYQLLHLLAIQLLLMFNLDTSLSLRQIESHPAIEQHIGAYWPAKNRGVEGEVTSRVLVEGRFGQGEMWGDVHCTCLYKFLGKIACAP